MSKIFSSLLVAAVCALSSPSLAQNIAPPSASQVTPGQEVERTTPEASIVLRLGGRLAAPTGAEGINLTINAINVVGGLPQLQRATNALLPAVGQNMSLAGVYDLASRLQDAYLAAGYPLVRVFVPVQDLDQANANIRLQVVSGSIASVDVSRLPAAVQRPVNRLLGQIVGKTPITSNELERVVLLAGEVAGLSLRSTLMAGQRQGDTILALDGDYQASQFAVSVDNGVAEDLGQNQITFSGNFNSIFGQGEQIGFAAATALDDISFGDQSRRRYLSLFADMPIGTRGLSFGVEATASTTRPGGFSALLDIETSFEKYGVSLSYPITRHRGRMEDIRLSFDAISERQQSNLLGFPVVLSSDRTRVVRLKFDEYLRVNPDFYVWGNVELSHGIDGLGARSAGDATVLEPLSRDGADAKFDKVEIGFGASVHMALDVIGTMNVAGQSSYGSPLLRSEQFSVIGSNLVSGPPSGVVLGDTGFAHRYELSRQFVAQVPKIDYRFGLSPYIFGAMSRAYIENPTAFEQHMTEVNAWGAGLRTGFALPKGHSLSFSYEFSRTDGNALGLSDDWHGLRLTLH